MSVLPYDFVSPVLLCITSPASSSFAASCRESARLFYFPMPSLMSVAATGLRQNITFSLFGATAPGGFLLVAVFSSLLSQRL
jgi:hypothetical protein